MNPNILTFALAAIGRMEAQLQNAETQFNALSQELQAMTADRDRLKVELEAAKKGKKE